MVWQVSNPFENVLMQDLTPNPVLDRTAGVSAFLAMPGATGRTASDELPGNRGGGLRFKTCLTTFALVAAIAFLTAGCEKKEGYSNVGSNGEVETPSAPVERTENIPPHKRFKNVQEACPPLPVKDGFVTVKMKVLQKDGGLEKGAGGSLKFDGVITLRLPEYARIGRKPAMYGECEYAQRVDIPYTWYKGKLIPGQGARFDIPSDHINRSVDVVAEEGGMRHLKDYQPNESWRFLPTIPHKFLPLEYYPRYRWETEAGPQYRSSDSGSWGVLNTKYKKPDRRRFTAWCAIEKPKFLSGQETKQIENGMVEDADSKCNGSVSFEKSGTIVTFAIRNWKDTVPEINHIYDAVYEEVQPFIQ